MGAPPLSGSSHETSTPVESRVAETTCGEAGGACAGGSNAMKRRGPPDWRAIKPWAALESPEPEVLTQLTQPSDKPSRPRPSLSTSKPLKSRRFRFVGQVVPPLQTGPTCTGSFGVASMVTQWFPPSIVCAIYRCQTPGKFALRDESPDVVVPRKPNAARLSSPATTTGKVELTILKAAPTFCGGNQCAPRSPEAVTFGVPSISI